MRKNTANVNNKNENQSNLHKNLKLDNSVEKKTKLKKNCIYSTMDGLSYDTYHNLLR